MHSINEYSLPNVLAAVAGNRLSRIPMKIAPSYHSLPLLAVISCLALVTLLPSASSAQSIIARSGNLQTGTIGGLAEISYNGGVTWVNLPITGQIGSTYGNAQSNGNYRNNANDTSGILGGTLTTATFADAGATGGAGYQGVVSNTETLTVTNAQQDAYNRISFTFTAPSLNFFVNGVARSDNAGYDAILNYNRSDMQTMTNFTAVGTTPGGTNDTRTHNNVPSSYSFSDGSSFTGGGTQQTFDIVWRDAPVPSGISFEVQFQPVPAPPAAVSLVIGGLVGMIGTGASRLRRRTSKRK